MRSGSAVREDSGRVARREDVQGSLVGTFVLHGADPVFFKLSSPLFFLRGVFSVM